MAASDHQGESDNFSQVANTNRIVIPLHTKRAIRGQLLQHAMAGVALFISATNIFSEQGSSYGWLLIIEIAVALGLVAAIIREIIQLKKKQHSALPWVDIWAGLVISTECVNRYLDGHLRMAIVWEFVAIIIVTLGFVRQGTSFFHRIIIDHTGIFVRTSKFSRFKINLTDIESITHSPSAIHIHTKNDADKQINLDAILHPEKISSTFYNAALRVGIALEKLEGFEPKGNK